jgi:hypothetical protein
MTLMAETTKKATKTSNSKKSVAVSKKVKSHGKDPFFVKKAKAMESILKKHGLPNTMVS